MFAPTPTSLAITGTQSDDARIDAITRQAAADWYARATPARAATVLADMRLLLAEVARLRTEVSEQHSWMRTLFGTANRLEASAVWLRLTSPESGTLPAAAAEVPAAGIPTPAAPLAGSSATPPVRLARPLPSFPVLAPAHAEVIRANNQVCIAEAPALAVVRDRLLEIGGREVLLHVPATNADRLAANLTLLPAPDVRLSPAGSSGCHRNAAHYVMQHWGDATLWTGFALSTPGLWTQHSWALRRPANRPETHDRVVEPTAVQLAYVGIALTDRELFQFVFDTVGRADAEAWLRRHPAAFARFRHAFAQVAPAAQA